MILCSEHYRCSHSLDNLSGGNILGVVRVGLDAMGTRRDVDVFLRSVKDEFMRIIGRVASTRLLTEINTDIVTASTPRSSVTTIMRLGEDSVQASNAEAFLVAACFSKRSVVSPPESLREVCSRGVVFSVSIKPGALGVFEQLEIDYCLQDRGISNIGVVLEHPFVLPHW